MQKDNDLEGILWETVAKYIPQISYQSGRISGLCLEVNGHSFIITNQHLWHTTIDGIVEVDEEGTYNKMSDVMFNFETGVFCSEHMSYYSQQDIDIPDEFRSHLGSSHFGSRPGLALSASRRSALCTYGPE